MLAEIEEKTRRIVALLQEEKLGGVLLNAQHNFAWLTGGASNGIDLSREAGAATLFVTAEGKRYLLANNIEMPRILAEQLSPEMFEPVEFSWQQEKSDTDLVFVISSRLTGGLLGSDLLLGPHFRTVEGSIAKCRYQLTREELDRLRALGKDASAAMDSMVESVSPGETESEIAAKLRSELEKAGIASVVTLAGADARIERYRHPVPTDNKWNKILLLVTCAKRAGLIVSLSRMLCVGPPPGDLLRKTEVAAFVNASLLHATRPGQTGATLYSTAANAYSERGVQEEIHRHHQGGAAGYKTREWVAHPTSVETVCRDQAFAWNPSITGTKVEETVIARNDGIEAVTDSALFPTIPIDIEGVTYYSPGILSV